MGKDLLSLQPYGRRDRGAHTSFRTNARKPERQSVMPKSAGRKSIYFFIIVILPELLKEQTMRDILNLFGSLAWRIPIVY